MSHLLVGLGICAAVLIYPGGPCLAVSWLLVLCGTSWAGWRRPLLPLRPFPAHPLSDWLLAGFLAALAVVPLSWPADPMSQISVGGLTGLGLGGVPLTLAALFSLSWLGLKRPRPSGAVPLALAWSLGLVLLATTTRSPGWASMFATAGLGQLLLRGGLGAVGLLALPWLGGPDPDRDLFTAAAWAAWLAVDLTLLVPGLSQLPFPAVLGCWWGLSLLAGVVLTAGAAQGGRWRADRRRAAPTDRM